MEFIDTWNINRYIYMYKVLSKAKIITLLRVLSKLYLLESG